MIRTFITAIPLQGGAGLEKGIYEPDGFTLENNRETSFPIVPIIAENMCNPKNVRIIALLTDNNDANNNYREFVEELSQMEISEEQITPIRIEENQGKKEELAAFTKIVDEIPDESLVYADITYGTKPMSAIILYTMSLIEKLNDSEAGGIYYGLLPRVKAKSDWNRAKIHDLTVFKDLSDIIEQLRALEVSDPRRALHRLLEV